MEGLGYIQAAIHTYVPILTALPFRMYLTRRNLHRLRWFGSAQSVALYSLPWNEFVVDVIAWLLIGVSLCLFYTIQMGASLLTGVKLLLGCVSFGVFGGMLCFLWMEKQIIEFLKRTTFEIPVIPKKIFSVSSKMRFFMVVSLAFMALASLLMVFMDIHYLLKEGGSLDTDIYSCVFREIAFAFAVLLFLSLVILGKYSRNLKAALSLQLDVMKRISLGEYDRPAPVVSNDEFGLIAAKTNEMMTGLKERDLCRLSFGRYVAPEVSEKILNGEIPLDGELREATLLFCDLRGYTTFVEGRNPKDVVSFLNEYFTEMDLAVKGNRGIVLQYIGDEIEAVFGAPLDLPHHPEMAVRAAITMRRRLEALNKKREAAGEPPVAHGIGIHTGRVFAGSVGSSERHVYALVGDPVNTASRIQALNKTFGTDILISAHTKGLLPPESFRLSSQGMVSLRGKSEGIEVFSVLGYL